jgi:hypothetical protein
VAEGEQPEQSREDRTRSVEADEELLRKVEEQLRDLKVSDVLLQTVYTISSLGWHKLSSTDRDLEQARLAIEALRALLPVLGGAMPAEVKRDLEQMVANMQLSYASAVGEAASTQAPKPEPEGDGEG